MGTSPSALLGSSCDEAALEVYSRLNETFAFVQDNIKTKQISSKKRYDKLTSVKDFDVGSWVYVWKPVPQNCTYKKFYDHYRGPFKVVKKLTPHTYKIVLDEEKGRFDVVHMEHLKDAQIPVGDTPPVVVKQYADDMSGGDDILGNLYDSTSDTEILDGNDATLTRSQASRRPGTLIRIPIPRRSDRIRTPRIPYQHIP